MWRSSTSAASHQLHVRALVSGAAVATLMAAGAGAAVGRATAGGASTPIDRAPAVATTPGAVALLPAAGPVGPHSVVAGVPVGFAHSPSGALLAAVSFNRALGSDLLLHPDAFRAAVDVMASPTARDGLRAKAETLLSTAEERNHFISDAAAGLPAVIASYPLAAGVTSYSRTSATVAVLFAGIFGNGQVPPTGNFAGGVWDLTWTSLPDGSADWRATDTHATGSWSSQPAGWPGLGMTLPFLTDLEPLGYAPPPQP